MVQEFKLIFALLASISQFWFKTCFLCFWLRFLPKCLGTNGRWHKGSSPWQQCGMPSWSSGLLISIRPNLLCYCGHLEHQLLDGKTPLSYLMLSLCCSFRKVNKTFLSEKIETKISKAFFEEILVERFEKSKKDIHFPGENAWLVLKQ